MTDTAKLRSWLAPALVVVLGAFIAWAFAASTLRVTRPFALPFDDSYRHLIEARELARFDEPASSLWSFVLAPFYLFGVRGHALVWLAYALAATLYVLAALGIYRFIVVATNDRVAATAAAVMALCVPSFAGASPMALGAALASGLLVARSRLLLAACGLAVIASLPDARIGLPDVHWLVWPVAAAGMVRIGLWAWREKRFVAGIVAIAAPFAFTPLVFACVGVAWSQRRILQVAACIGAVVYLVYSYRPVREAMTAQARLAAELNRTSIMLGETIHRRYRDGSFLVQRRGALAYHADVVTRTLREDGFEYVDGLRPEHRTTHLALPSNALGVGDFTGDVLTSAKGLVVATARWDHAGTAERPMNDHTGWAIVDRIDVGDLASERAHEWSGATNALVERSTAGGLAIDGGRTIDQGERFVARIDPAKPTRIILRTGGQRAYPGHATITAPIDLALFVGTKQIGKLTIAPPAGPFAELTFTLPPQPAAALVLRTRPTNRYRAFHWFILQPG